MTEYVKRVPNGTHEVYEFFSEERRMKNALKRAGLSGRQIVKLRKKLRRAAKAKEM